MSFNDKIEAESEVDEFRNEAGELGEALSDFRMSVHAWSEAEFNRPRTAIEPARRRFWRLAVGWALGCVLVFGSVSGGVAYRHRQNEIKIAQARIAEQQRLAAQAQARQEEEDLLAKVDSDVSREVPSAMEPLARLMAEDESQ
jgi:Tfp pilus assembly protein PilN